MCKRLLLLLVIVSFTLTQPLSMINLENENESILFAEQPSNSNTWEVKDTKFTGPGACRTISPGFQSTADEGFTRIIDGTPVDMQVLSSCLMVASEHNDLSNLDFTYTNSVIAEDELVTFSWIHSEASDGPSVYSSAGTTIEIPSTVITCTLNLEIYSCVSNDEVLIKPDAVISISVSTLPNDILDSEGESLSLVLESADGTNLMSTIQAVIEEVDTYGNELIDGELWAQGLGYTVDPSSLDPFVMTPGSYLNVPVGMGGIGSDFSGCFWFSVHSKDTGLVSEYDFAIQMQPSLSESDESLYRNKNNNPVCVSENGIGAFFISTQSGEIPTFFAGLIASYDSSEGDYTLYANFVDDSSGVSSSVAIVDVTIQNSFAGAVNTGSFNAEVWVESEQWEQSNGFNHCRAGDRMVAFSIEDSQAPAECTAFGRAHSWVSTAAGQFHLYTLPYLDSTDLKLLDDDLDIDIAPEFNPGTGSGSSSGTPISVGEFSRFAPNIQLDLGDDGTAEVIILATPVNSGLTHPNGYSIMDTQSMSELESDLNTRNTDNKRIRGLGGTSYLKGWSGSDALALAGNTLSDGGDATVLVPGVDFVAPSMSADREVMVGLVDPTQIGLQEGIDLVINPLLLRDVLEPGDYYLTVLTGDIVDAAEYAGYAGRESASSVEGFMSAPWSRLHIDFTVLSQASPDVYLTGGASDCWDEDLLVCSIEISEGEDLSSFEDFIQIIAKNPGVDASPYHGQIYSTLDSSGDSSITRHVVGGAFDTCPCSCGMADCPGDTSVGPPRCVQCCKDWCKDKDVRVWGDIDSGNADDEQDTELAEERSATDDSVRVLCYCRDGSVSSCIQSSPSAPSCCSGACNERESGITGTSYRNASSCSSELDSDRDGLEDSHCFSMDDGTSVYVPIFTSEEIRIWNESSLLSTGPVWDGMALNSGSQTTTFEAGKTRMANHVMYDGRPSFSPHILPLDETNRLIDSEGIALPAPTPVVIGPSGTFIGQFDVSTMRPILENASEGDVFEIHLSPSVENCTMENPLVIRYTVSSAQVSSTEEPASGEVVAIAGGLLLVACAIGVLISSSPSMVGSREESYEEE